MAEAPRRPRAVPQEKTGYEPALLALEQGGNSLASDDVTTFVGNMAGVWLRTGFPGDQQQTARHFYDLMVEAIGPCAALARDGFNDDVRRLIEAVDGAR